MAEPSENASNLPRTHPRLGIVGGGQLAKLTAGAATSLGCEVVILERQEEFPAHSVDTHALVGDWNQPEPLLRLASMVDRITLENEFVSLDALAVLEAKGHLVCPSVKSLHRIQDKYLQKNMMEFTGVPVVEFADAPSPAAVRGFGFPCVLKKRRNSYDGKGNASVVYAAELEAAWAALDGDRNPLYVERFCPFDKEVAVIVTRSAGGDVACYPVVETTNRDHICHSVTYPAAISSGLVARASEVAVRIITEVAGVGSFGIEFFVCGNEELFVNEIAPRVHNTGHYTVEACVCSQFENHVRAVFGWPLGSTEPVVPAAAMVNLLGAGPGDGTPVGLETALAVSGAHVHIYGKTRSSRGRKMGHVTALDRTAQAALAAAQRAADCIRFGS